MPRSRWNFCALALGLAGAVVLSLFAMGADRPGPTAAPSKTIVRFQDEKSGAPRYGLIEGDSVRRLAGAFEDLAAGKWQVEDSVPLKDLKILTPVAPSKIVCFGWTFPAHATEVGGEPDRAEPLVFLKPPSCLIADGEAIHLPAQSGQVEFEGELAIIIGKRARNVKPEEALDYVFGYTCLNDVSARDLIQKDAAYARGKGFDTFGPIGPRIVTGLDPSNLRIVTRLNGEIKQDGNTSDMSFRIPFLISYISRVMTLEPGDVLASGTPPGSVPIKPGDVVRVEIEKIGSLTNPVR